MDYKKIEKNIEILIDEKFENLSIQHFFENYHLSKKHIHELRMSKAVFLNNEPIFQNFHTLLKDNDKLSFPFFIDEEIDFIAQDIPLDIVYEDDFILVINKQANIEVHPDSKVGLNTVVNAVSYYYQQTKQNHRIRYIHRLDKDTTGIIVFVKQYFVHNLYDYLLSQKLIKRYYKAICENNPKKQTGIILAPIAKDRHHSLKRIVSKTGSFAKTKYRVLQTIDNQSFLDIEIFTGRTHQIRVHLASINCPIVGDPLYGIVSEKINRQALHAYKIKLIHPITLEPFTLNIPLPKDMVLLLESF